MMTELAAGRAVRPGSGARSRRAFLASGLGVGAAALLPLRPRPAAGAEASAEPAAAGWTGPVLDLHVHLDNSTIEQVLPLARERGVRFGIVEHAGTEANKYPVVLSSDEELSGYLAMLEGKGVYRGVQAEWTDWMECFSPEMRGRLDYVLTDAMTFPGKDGRRVKLWEAGVGERVEMSDRQSFMDRYVDWHVEIIERQPIDILANLSWLPEPLAGEYDALWTEARVLRVARAAVRKGVALEISSGFNLPKRGFLEIARSAGARFSFGSNGRYPNMGKLEHSLAMARALGLKETEIYVPPEKG